MDHLARGLAGIGLDRVAGYWNAEVIDEWRSSGRRLQTSRAISLEELVDAVAADRVTAVDVRSPAEWAAGHLAGARNFPLGDLEQRLGELPRGRLLAVHCQTGARAAMAASLLLARGIPDVRLYGGGFAEWSAAGRPVETARA